MQLLFYFIFSCFCAVNINKLQPTGSGIREKKILLFYVDVYKLESFASEKKSIENSKEKALKLTLLRDLKNSDIVKSFSERLEKNEINITDPNIQQIFKSIPAEVKKGEVINFLGEKLANNQEQLTVQFPNHNLIVNGKNLVTNFWKIWFGKTEDDSGLQKLKEQLCYQEPK